MRGKDEESKEIEEKDEKESRGEVKEVTCVNQRRKET